MEQIGIYFSMFSLLLMLAGCGGSSNRSDDNPTQTSGNTGYLLLLDPTHDHAAIPIANLQYLPDGSSSTADGKFSLPNGTQPTLYLGADTRLNLSVQATLNQNDIATAFCRNNVDPTACQDNTALNLERFFLSLDADRNSSNGIQLDATANTLELSWMDSPDRFAVTLARQLAPYGLAPARLFEPSLGINTEAAQSEQNDIVLPMPFVDIFRTARPFAEYSCKDVRYDENGWPNARPASCDGQTPSVVRTFMLDNVARGMVPEGRYTVLYEGDATLNYSGYASLVNHEPGRDIIDIKLPDKPDPANAFFNRVLLQIASGTAKNIRVIMPGGICEGNPFARVEEAAGCPAGQYQSFEETLRADRNAIVFNPDYLNFMQDFHTVRMMNLMEASPNRFACPQTASSDYDQNCLLQALTWDQRSKLDDAVWGGSGNISEWERFGRGTPLEVQVELANQLNANPWFTLPHNATDYYVRQFAYYVDTHLKPGLKPYVEYTNEAWNDQFLATHYVRQKGLDAGLAADYTNREFWAGALYYAKRASEVFQLWKEESSNHEPVTILGTYQASADLTRNMLAYSDVRQHVDAIATGAYFYACWDRSNTKCQDETSVPKPLVEASSLDDIFAAIDNPADPYGLPALKNNLAAQARVADDFGKKLFAYEGGQHLIIAGAIDSTRRDNMLDFLHAANRDPRMGERYRDLLNSWKTLGGDLFMLFSVPHTYSRYGSFGIKESLNQLRTSAPKYDAAMKFQEAQGSCWWSGC